MKITAASALAALLSTADALQGKQSFAVLRFTNKQLTQGRADPIVSPGKISPHVHTIMGGSGFGLGATAEDLDNSKCSTALVKGDNSNYWFPTLYFKDPKTGDIEPVELFYAQVYYFFDNSNDKIKAFPKGLQIVSGDPKRRVAPEFGGGAGNTDPSKGPISSAKFSCPRSNYNPPSWDPKSDGSMAGIADPNLEGEGVGFPDRNCDGYASPLRADVHFPSCYNPNAGLTDHENNMAWPTDAGNGKKDCPKGYIHVPHLFLEAYWDTPKFVDRWEQGQGKQPFVLSNGDVTGFGSHADFMAAWDEELLQNIIDNCDTGTGGMDQCPGLKGLNKGDCTIPPPVDETITGLMNALPGDNPLQGWSYGVTGGSTPDQGDSSSAAPAPTVGGKDGDDEAATTSAASKPTDSTAAPRPEFTTLDSELPRPTNVVNPVIDEPTETQPAETEVDDTKPVETPKPTAGKGRPGKGSSKSRCRSTHTVYKTVSVTQSSGAAAPTAANVYYKRDRAEQRVREHASRRRSLRH